MSIYFIHREWVLFYRACHVSTVAQSGQTKVDSICLASFGQGDCQRRCIQLVASCNLNPQKRGKKSINNMHDERGVQIRQLAITVFHKLLNDYTFREISCICLFLCIHIKYTFIKCSLSLIELENVNKSKNT